MPILKDGKTIEEIQLEHLRGLNPEDKIRMASRLNANIWEIVRERLRDEHPEWDEHALKFETARRFYFNDPKALKLLFGTGKKELE